MLKTKWVLLALLLVALPVLADTMPGTAAVASEQPGFFSWENLQKIMEYGLGVFLFVAALKNVPFFADFFAAWGWLAPVTAAGTALCTAIILCNKMPGHDSVFYLCIATALGIFLSAVGIHGVVAKLSPDSSLPAVNPERVAKLNGGSGTPVPPEPYPPKKGR